jgi:L-ascorbate metabolism protein UlaG (beta-lactamase superfamily)
MPISIPPDATFRRAEGLTLSLSVCDGLDAADLRARRHGGDTRQRIAMDEVRLLMRMSRWRRADELGVPHEALVKLVEMNAVFWSPERPERDLTGEPIGALEGRIALRGNVSPIPLLRRAAGLEDEGFPQMPRLGELDTAELSRITFVTSEWDHRVAAVNVSCCARHLELVRDLTVALDGRHDVDELVAGEGPGTGAERRALLEAFDACGLLERHAAPIWDGEARVTWLVHAAVLYEARGRRIVVDPISMHPRSLPTRLGASYDLRDLGPLDAVLITHGDNDHLNANNLHRIDRRTPIVIPRVHARTRYQPEMRGVLAVLGFERVIEVDEWDRLTFGDVTVVVAPFRGEDWGLTLACRAYLIHSDDLTIYLNADSTSTPEAYDRLAAEFAIDVAFLGVTGNEESHLMPPGFGYGEFYARFIPRQRHNQWVRHCNGPRESAEAARRLRARFAFGYAAGGADFFPVAYSDRGTHQELARALAGGPTRALELELGVPRAASTFTGR